MKEGSKFKKWKPNEVINLMEDDKDRFSILPDSVAHFIFSFLTIEDIARLSLTSKRCKKFCQSVPKLIIDASQIKSTTAHSPKRTQFMDFLASLIADHQSTELTSLTINWSDVELFHDDLYRILSLLNNAIHCRVNEVDLRLKLIDKGVFVLPLELFYCQSLKSLKVNMNHRSLGIPYPYGFAHLECLHLNAAKIVSADFGKWVSSFCKFLKKLYLKQLSDIGRLKIVSSSLKHIDIEKCDLELDISSQTLESICLDLPSCSSWNKKPLNICAPNVSSLTLNVSSTNSCSLGKMNLLQVASLQFSSCSDRDKSSSPCVLSSIDQTRHLVINCASIKDLCDGDCLPFSFDNLQTLELHHCFLTNEVMRAMAMFFQKLQPGVKTLDIKPIKGFQREKDYTYEYASGCGEFFWETQNILFLGGLEKLKIDLAGGRNEEVIVEYFLNNATKLKKVVILCGRSLPTKISSKMTSLALASGANFRAEEGMMILELKPKS